MPIALDASSAPRRYTQVLPVPAVVLTFFVYEEAHRRALKRTRFELRSARGEHFIRANPKRGNRDGNQQSRRRAWSRTRKIAWHCHARNPVERIGTRDV